MALVGLIFLGVPSEYIPPFNQFSISKITAVTAAVGAPTLDAAAPVESTAPVPAGTPFTALKGLRLFPALSAGSRAPVVLCLLMLRYRRMRFKSVVRVRHDNFPLRFCLIR